MTLLVRWRIAVLAVFVFLAVSACGRSPEELFERAQASAKNKDAAAAVLDLKNALEDRPDYGPARRLLGQQYLELGDTASAVKELERALNLGESEKEVLPLILRAELDGGGATKVLERLAKLNSDDLSAPLWSLRGEALIATGDFAAAEEAYQTALRMNTADADAHLGMARIAWEKNDSATADREFARAIQLAPTNTRYWLTRGDFALARRQFPVALQAFNTALKHGQGFDKVRAQLGLARTNVFKADFAAAQKHVDLLLKQAPEMPMVHYLAALVAQQKGNWKSAEEHLALVLARAPEHIPSIFLQGVVAAAQKKWVTAEQSLARVVAKVPGDLQSRKLLANVYLQEGQTAKAIATLEEGESLGSQDAQFLAMLGGAYMRSGQSEKGLAVMERAAAMAPNNPEFRTQVGLGHLALGESAAATAELRAAANLSADDMRSDVMLVMVLLRDRKFDEALAEAQRLIKENPKDPIRYNLAAAAWLGKSNDAEATRSLQRALQLDPKFGPAKLNLALLAQRRNDVDGAYKLYQEVWADDTTNYRALASIVQIDFQRNRGKEAVALLEKTRLEQPRALEPRKMLQSLYAQSRDFSRALVLAKEMLDIEPRSPNTRFVYAEMLLGAQRFGEAIGVLEPLARDVPSSVDVHFQLGRAKFATGSRIDARRAIERALELNPKHVPSLQMAVSIAIEDGRFDEAKKSLATLRAQPGDAVSLDVLDGDIAVAEQRWPAAIASYRKVLQSRQSTDVLGKLTTALSRSGQVAVARTELQAWIRRYPRDMAAQLWLGDAQLNLGQPAEAQATYEGVLKVAPNNPFALNNLAWLYLQRADRRALAMAEKALSLLPTNAEIMDTTAWIRFKTGRRDGIVEMLRKAADRSTNPEIRYHIAEVLASQGDRAGARRELDRILGPNSPPFQSKAAAVALRQRM